MEKDKVLTGAAGTYYVAFQLSAQGYAVGLTTYGTKAIDLFVANPDTGKSITIQTKTGSDAFVRSKKYGTFWHWRVGKPRKAHKSFFYVFVDLKKNDPSQTPDAFIVPSGELGRSVRRVVYPRGVDPESPKAKDFWCGIDEEDGPKYKNRWDVIEDALA
jgi:hypothetical protein